MRAFANLVIALYMPLGIINTFSGIIGGAWLAILGEWSLIGDGLVALFLSIFVLFIAMIPNMFFAASHVALSVKGNKFWASFFLFLSGLYTMAVLTFWCLLVLYHFVRNVNVDITIPVLLWSFCVAIGPISYMAQKDIESGNIYSTISTIFAQIAYILVSITILLFRVSLLDITILFGATMFVGLILELWISSQFEGTFFDDF